MFVEETQYYILSVFYSFRDYTVPSMKRKRTRFTQCMTLLRSDRLKPPRRPSVMWVNHCRLVYSSLLCSSFYYLIFEPLKKQSVKETTSNSWIPQLKISHSHADSQQVCYKEKYYNSRGTLLPMPFTPELMHFAHVNEINSDVCYVYFLQIFMSLCSFGFIFNILFTGSW